MGNELENGHFNASAHVNVLITTLYNMTRKHEQLLFVRVTAYNATFNYTMYNLVYRAERSQYNFTLITKILTDPKTGEYTAFVTGMNIAPDDKNKAVPVGDTVVVGNLTLSDYYWTLNEVLMKLRRGDETNWIWGMSAYELRHLSHLVKLKLAEYNNPGTLAMQLLWTHIPRAHIYVTSHVARLLHLYVLAAAGSSGGGLGGMFLRRGILFCFLYCCLWE